MLLTFLPLALILVNAICATAILVGGWGKRWIRQSVLVVFPLLGLGTWFIVGPAVAYNGNLAFAGFSVIYIIFLTIYYPALLVTWIIYLIRGRAAKAGVVTEPN